MPGLVRDVKVTVGDTVEKGEPLLILEAMKMENVIRADAVVTIKSIHTAVGDAVDKNQLLIAFE
ncbi:MAG: acetyl-CoA carboxylase biotin carboxyl carrier protein subunit [Saprospiraceae bacterium]|nr:acetyl-CoA carboxylase biotin carboxyl carrier protein subunit [Saprospiraceae bacterium]MBP7679586.1 acetyl-CoA carboxylase biotin carboxyl carrier protein subunit [Saprospiraceae bacterium]